MARKRSNFGNWLEYLAFKSFLFAVRLLPLTWGKSIGKRLGRLAFAVLKGRRELTLENIRHAKENGFLGAETDVELLAGKVWENIGLIGSEFLYHYTHRPELLKQSVELVGREKIDRILSKGKGAILVMGHIGNWELLGMALSLAGYKVTPIVKVQANELVDRIIQDNRRSVGMKVISSTGFLRPVLEAFKQNEIVPFLIDQSAGKKGIKVKVFGRDASIPRGAAEFALKTGTPVFFAYIIREGKGHHQLIVSDEICLIKTGDKENDVRANIELFMGFLQKAIIAHPSQWLWMHKLWSTKIKI